jgi:hypothetical protein
MSAIEILRGARDLMNHGGRHWIKDAEHRYVTKDHKPGGTSGLYPWGGHGIPPEGYEHAYCSIGAINAIAEQGSDDHRIATIALAEVMNPAAMGKLRKRLEKDYKSCGYAGEELMYRVDHELLSAAQSFIVRFNDNRRRKWPEVRAAFTTAARRLSQRKQK